MTVIPLEAQPLTQAELRDGATELRRRLGLDKTPHVDVAHLFEITLPQVFSGFDYDIRTKAQMGKKHGAAYPSKRLILLREDVYDGIKEGNGQDRVTAIHEIAHVLLHTDDRIALCKAKGQLEDCKNPEWQADVFAREFLASHLFVHLCDGPEALASLTGVSIADARMQWEAYKRDGLIK